MITGVAILSVPGELVSGPRQGASISSHLLNAFVVNKVLESCKSVLVEKPACNNLDGILQKLPLLEASAFTTDDRILIGLERFDHIAKLVCLK